MKQIQTFGLLLKGCCPAAVVTTPGETAGVTTSRSETKTFLIQLYFPLFRPSAIALKFSFPLNVPLCGDVQQRSDVFIEKQTKFLKELVP